MGREPAHIEHTFRSGWTATIWRHLPMQWLMQQAIERGELDVADAFLQLQEDGQLTPQQGIQALRMERDIVQAMFVRPRVVWDTEDLPDGWDPMDPDRNPIPAVELSDDELAEVLELALQGVSAATAFRSDTAGTGPGADSPPVAKPAQRPRRAAAGKR